MISIQASFLRFILRLRKAGMDWEAPVGKYRRRMERGEEFIKLPGEVDFKPVITAGVPAEWITPARISSQSVILYIHGGGWTMSLYNLERQMAASICQAAGCRALALEYRLAPEHPFPAALEDCLIVYRELLKNGASPRNLVIAGASAGGNLTLATLMALRDAGDPLPAAAVVISPMTDLAGTGESFHAGQDPALTPAFALNMARHYAGDHDLRSPLLSPHYGDLRGLPRLLIHAGGDEILLSDSMRLADKAQAAGVEARLVVWPKMWHVWHFFTPFLPEARQAIQDIGNFIREHPKS